jgi:formylglycine-generating enzyme required for sulfatase activity
VVERRPLPLIWLVLLTIAGLGTGSGVGYLLLKRLGPKAPVQGTLPAQPSPPGPGQGGVQPGQPGQNGAADPMVPAGRCPQGMRLVSGGTYKRGSPADEKDRLFDERPLESVQVPSFCMDEYEYPNQAGAPPTVDVSWDDAQQSCLRVGKRLCKEDEWEKACKGPGNARFPYGNDFDANLCNTDDAEGRDRALAESGRFAQCRSAYQVADLSGNVAEWTSSAFGGSTASRTQKGGAYDRPVHAVKCSSRISAPPTERKPTVGFRCCADVKP